MSAHPSPSAILLPVAPLVDALRLAGGFPPRDRPHVSRLSRAYQRAVRRGRISVTHADEICVHILDRPAATVYGRAWVEAGLPGR